MPHKALRLLQYPRVTVFRYRSPNHPNPKARTGLVIWGNFFWTYYGGSLTTSYFSRWDRPTWYDSMSLQWQSMEETISYPLRNGGGSSKRSGIDFPRRYAENTPCCSNLSLTLTARSSGHNTRNYPCSQSSTTKSCIFCMAGRWGNERLRSLHCSILSN